MELSKATEYTAGEWLALMVIAPVLSSVVVIALIPLMLLTAWMRVKMWDWFAVPYLHLPHVSVWLMLAIGIFLSTFNTDAPALKDEYYASKAGARFIGQLLITSIGFGLAWAIHAWILTGAQ